MTDWTPEEDEAFNDVEKHSNLGKQILREIGQPYHFEKREWIGLTADEMETLYQQATYMDDTDHIHMLMMAEAKLKEKNT